MSNSIVFVSSIISTLVVFVPAQFFESQPSLSFAIQPPPVLQNIPKNNFFDQASSAAVVRLSAVCTMHGQSSIYYVVVDDDE
jgi:hypothetical protein